MFLPALTLRFLRVVIGPNILAFEFLIEFTSLPRDVQRLVSRSLGFSPGLRHRFGVTLRSAIRLDRLGFTL